MKKEINGKIFESDKLTVIGISKSVVSVVYYDNDDVCTFNLANKGDEALFYFSTKKYGLTTDELDIIYLKSYAMFD